MMRPLIIEPEAEADLKAAYGWYEERDGGLGMRFLVSIDAALGAIAERPTSFPVVHKHTHRALVSRFPYLILFVEIEDLIAVIGVFHTSRHPKHWRTRAR